MNRRMVLPRIAALAAISLLFLIPHSACEDGQTCASLDTGTSCGSGRVCNMSLSCTTTCEDGSSCDAGMACWNGICEPSCEVETTCGAGMACSNGICAPKCDTSTPCGHGLTCGLNLVCTARCDDETPCATGMQCSNGGCQLKSTTSCVPNEINTPCGDREGMFCMGGYCYEACVLDGEFIPVLTKIGCLYCFYDEPPAQFTLLTSGTCWEDGVQGTCDEESNCIPKDDNQCLGKPDGASCYPWWQNDVLGVCKNGTCGDMCRILSKGDVCTKSDGSEGHCNSYSRCINLAE